MQPDNPNKALSGMLGNAIRMAAEKGLISQIVIDNHLPPLFQGASPRIVKVRLIVVPEDINQGAAPLPTERMAALPDPGAPRIIQ